MGFDVVLSLLVQIVNLDRRDLLWLIEVWSWRSRLRRKPLLLLLSVHRVLLAQILDLFVMLW